MHPVIFAGACALSLAIAAPAGAVEYSRVLPAKSGVSFEYRQMGMKLEGRFRRFTAELAFDPARPAQARVAFDVDLASLDAGSDEADEAASGSDWFDTSRFPRARFVSKSVRTLGRNRFEVRGVLTLRGKSREMAVPVSLRPDGSSAIFEGEFTLKRLDFGVGSGAWTDTDTVANDVAVRVRLAADGQ